MHLLVQARQHLWLVLDDEYGSSLVLHIPPSHSRHFRWCVVEKKWRTAVKPASLVIAIAASIAAVLRSAEGVVGRGVIAIISGRSIMKEFTAPLLKTSGWEAEWQQPVVGVADF